MSLTVGTNEDCQLRADRECQGLCRTQWLTVQLRTFLQTLCSRLMHIGNIAAVVAGPGYSLSAALPGPPGTLLHTSLTGSLVAPASAALSQCLSATGDVVPMLGAPVWAAAPAHPGGPGGPAGFATRYAELPGTTLQPVDGMWAAMGAQGPPAPE